MSARLFLLAVWTLLFCLCLTACDSALDEPVEIEDAPWQLAWAHGNLTINGQSVISHESSGGQTRKTDEVCVQDLPGTIQRVGASVFLPISITPRVGTKAVTTRGRVEFASRSVTESSVSASFVESGWFGGTAVDEHRVGMTASSSASGALKGFSLDFEQQYVGPGGDVLHTSERTIEYVLSPCAWRQGQAE